MAPISPQAAAAAAAHKRSAPILMPGNESEAAGLLDAYLAAQQGQAAMS